MKKGFTLIELLVVVAIIGILASVVLASLNSARSKGADAAVKSNLDTVRTQAVMYYNVYNAYRTTSSIGSGDYGGDCNTIGTVFQDSTGTTEGQTLSKTIAAAITGAYNAGRGAKTCKLTSIGNQYMVAVGLKSSSTAYWCVDSKGNSLQTASLPSGFACQ